VEDGDAERRERDERCQAREEDSHERRKSADRSQVTGAEKTLGGHLLDDQQRCVDDADERERHPISGQRGRWIRRARQSGRE
jgi:hypothetical protein